MREFWFLFSLLYTLHIRVLCFTKKCSKSTGLSLKMNICPWRSYVWNIKKIHLCLEVAQEGHRSKPPKKLCLRFGLVTRSTQTDFHVWYHFETEMTCAPRIISSIAPNTRVFKNTRVRSAKTRISDELLVSLKTLCDTKIAYIFTFKMSYRPRKSDRNYAYSAFFSTKFSTKKVNFMTQRDWFLRKLHHKIFQMTGNCLWTL